MEKKIITGLIIFLFTMHISGKYKSPPKKALKDTTIRTIPLYEAIRGSPTDTMASTKDIDSNFNIIKLNGKIIKSKTDTLGNEINVDGFGNSISIEQTENSSKVIVSQKGKSNNISIIQK